MTWTRLAHVVLRGFLDGTAKGRKLAEKELFNMARAADRSDALEAELTRARAQIKALEDKT